MRRKLQIYFGLLIATLSLFATGVELSVSQRGYVAWTESLIRFSILLVAFAAAAGTWAVAVMIAYVHRVRWPFLLLVGMVVTVGLTFALVRGLAQ